MNRREIIKIVAALLGGSLAQSLTSGVLAGVVGTDKPSRDVFPGDTRQKTAVLAEMIIPKTDTPGAIEAGVPNFIEVMVADWYTDVERKLFFDGLAALDVFCEKNYRKKFLQCTVEQHIAALKDAENSASTYQGPMLSFDSKVVDPNTPFFAKIKELTVLGYYSSEVGAKQELSYNPMPMRFEGDYDFSKVGKQWSW